ncbi:hypothetical protein OC00_17485, partial [Xanthomonas vasicola]
MAASRERTLLRGCQRLQRANDAAVLQAIAMLHAMWRGSARYHAALSIFCDLGDACCTPHARRH